MPAFNRNLENSAHRDLKTLILKAKCPYVIAIAFNVVVMHGRRKKWKQSYDFIGKLTNQ